MGHISSSTDLLTINRALVIQSTVITQIIQPEISPQSFSLLIVRLIRLFEMAWQLNDRNQL
jgi:hypothetical protein